MIRLNYGCDKRVYYCVLIFVLDIVPSVSTIQWDLKKTCLRVNIGLSPTANEKKDQVRHKSPIYGKDHRLIFIKKKIFFFGIGTSSAMEYFICRFF